MRRRDPYDPRVAFDDVFGGEEIHDEAPRLALPPVALLRAIVLIVSRARALRLAPPEFDVAPARDSTVSSFAGPRLPRARATGAPVYDDLVRRFEAAAPAPRLVRLDNERSYADFRSARRTPYLRQLEARVAALESALARHESEDADYFDDLEDRFSRHVSDGHGGDADVLGAEVASAVERVVRGGDRVNLSLPAWAAGKIDCWQDGGEVLCTVRLADGRLLTSGAQLGDHVEEVLGCCAGIGRDEVRTLAPVLSLRAAGESLVRGLVRAAPAVLGATGGASRFVGLATPRVNPTRAAMMALLQRCQRGDERALADARALERAGAPVVSVCERLLAAQAMKAKRRIS